MSSHQFSARDGIGTVRANFVKTPEQIAAIAQQRAETARIIAEHQAAIAARPFPPMPMASVRSVNCVWTPELIAELRHLRLDKNQTATQIAAHFNITYTAGSNAVYNHCGGREARANAAAPDKRAALHKVLFSRPSAEAARVSENVERKCSTCGVHFLAPTRFVRRCKLHTIGGAH